LAWLLGLTAAEAVGSEIIENPSYTGPKTTVTYAMWGGAGEVKYAREICRKFVEANPDIRVDVSVYPWGQYWAKIQTQTAGGIAPDVMSFYSGAVGVWASRGALLPLDRFLEGSGIRKEEFHAVALRNMTWNGRLYCMPLELPIWTLAYNKDRLEESGIPRSQWPKPTEPLTWDQFRALAKRLTLRRPDGTFAQYGMSAGNNWDRVMIGMYGGYFTDRRIQPTRPTVVGNEPLKRAVTELFLSQYADRWTLGAVPLNAGSFASSHDMLLATNRFAMSVVGPWALKPLVDQKARIGLAPMPRNVVPIQEANANGVGINAFTKHPDAAWKLVRFMVTPEIQRIFGSNLKGVPALKEAADSLVNNIYGIEGCEAYLHDLDVAQPMLTTDNTYLQSAYDKWWSKLEQKLDTEYDRRLNEARGGRKALSNAEYAAFVRGMDRFVRQAVDEAWPELDAALRDAFERAAPREYGPFVRYVLPALVFAGFLAGAVGYVRWVRRNSKPVGGGLRQNNLAGYLFVSPWLFGFLCFVLGPILASIFLSFTKWNMIAPPNWVGFENYLGLLQDERFRIGLKNTLLYAAFVIPISLFGGLLTAGLLTTRIKGADTFKAILYFPALFTGAEAAVLWVNMLNKEYGVLNYVLSWFGVQPVNWMDEAHAFYSVILMNVFWIGGAMVIYYAGMKQIPAALYEAAELDGAGPLRKFFSVTIPMLSPVILFMVVMTTIGAFQVFTPALFFASSSAAIGEPGDALRFYAVNIYDEAFNNLRMGNACTYALVLFLIIFCITMAQMKLSRRFVHTEGA